MLANMGSHGINMDEDDTASLPLGLFIPNSSMGFMDTIRKKMKQGPSKKQHHMAGAAMNIFMFSVTTSMLVIGYTSLVPYFFDQYGGWNSYYIKVFITFVYIQTWANWICVKSYQSIYKNTGDEHHLYQAKIDLAQGNASQNGQTSRTEPLKLMSPLGQPLEEDLNILLHRERDVLSWTWCYQCQQNKPPRAHHCMICGGCVMLRDHHCYLTNTCIGFYNQRFFTLLTFYVSVACYGGLSFGIVYLYREYWPVTQGSDYFPPIALYRTVFEKKYHFEFFILITLLYTLPCIGSMCVAFFFYQLILISIGKTPFEYLKNLHLKNTRTYRKNFNSVFGDYCLMNWIIPFHLICPQQGDPALWPNMKIVYKRKLKKLKKKYESMIV